MRKNFRRTRCQRAVVETCEQRRHLSGGFCGCEACMAGASGLLGGGSEASVLNRWSQTATNPTTGSVGNPISLTWGFVPDGLSIPGLAEEPTSPSVLQARLNALYGSSANWLPVFQSIFDRWASVSGVTYQYFGLSDDGAAFDAPGALGVRPDIRLAGHSIDGQGIALAYNDTPGGRMVIDTDDFLTDGFFTETSNNSLYLRNTVAHELGHGLGLGHTFPTNFTKLMEPFFNSRFDGPQFDDILGAQTLYGDPFEKNGRNDTAATASDLGMLSPAGPDNPISSWNHPVNPMLRSIANTDDADYLKFSLSDPATVQLTLSPVGPTYFMGTSSIPWYDFDASEQGNLNFQLIGPDGSTVYRSADTNGLGDSEFISITLFPGTYYLRVGMTSGETQPYNIRATITPPEVPFVSTPRIDPANDSGFSNSDGVTNANAPAIIGSAQPGVTIYLSFAGESGNVTAQGVAGANGTYRIVPGILADGIYTLQASTANAAGQIVPVGEPRTLVIDTAAPQITNINFDRSIQSVNISYTETIIGVFPVAAVQLVNQTTGETFATLPDRPVPNLMSYVVDGWRLTDGRYVANYTAGNVRDRAGNLAISPPPNPFLSFNFLRADFNNDSRVDFGDLLILAQNYGTIYGGSPNNTIGDANYDIRIDFNDLLILAQQYGSSALASANALAVIPAKRQQRRSAETSLL